MLFTESRCPNLTTPLFLTFEHSISSFPKKCYDNYIKQVETSFCTNPKSFWDFVRKNKKGSNLPATVNLNGIFSSNRNTMCELFSKHFSSVFSPQSLNVDSCGPGGLPYDLPSSCNISLSDVASSLANLRLTKLVGPDGLSGFLFTTLGLSCVFHYFSFFIKYHCLKVYFLIFGNSARLLRSLSQVTLRTS